ELGPALGINRHRGAQIDQRLLEAFRSHGRPPVDVAGVPAFKRTQDLPILGEVHVVGDLGRVIDGLDGHRTLLIVSTGAATCAAKPSWYRTPAAGRCRSA